ncbi:MAG: hypothetical protein KF729_37225 [Sandaracinaceae bacterium]|nr:hypothetical protein [Sandaracinaceae bacterium]
MRFFRYYDSRWARAQRGLGYGHRHGFEHWLVFDLDGVTYRAPDGKDRHFRHFTDDGERQASGGVWLERVSEERYELTGYGLPKLVFRRSARARDAELVEWIEEVDGREERLRFVYEAGRLDKILAPRNETLKLAWSADGLLAGVEHWSSDGHGKKWLIRYEYEHGYLTAGTDAYKQTFRLAYDENGLVCRRTDRRGYSFYFEYDSKGRCVASRGVDGLLSVQLTYKPLEYETRVVDANGAEWIYQYTPEGVVTLITDPYGGVEYFKLGDDGRLLERYDPNGAKTSYVYDAAGAAIARIDPDGRRVTLPEPEVEPPRYGERVPTRAIQLEQGDAWDPSFRLPDPYELPFDLPAEVHAALTTSTHLARGAVETEHDPYCKDMICPRYGLPTGSRGVTRVVRALPELAPGRRGQQREHTCRCRSRAHARIPPRRIGRRLQPRRHTPAPCAAGRGADGRTHSCIVRRKPLVNMATLTDVQDEALAALERSTCGHIDVHVRQRVWAALGPVIDRASREGGVVSPAHRARGYLMCECLRLALPEWEEERTRATARTETLLDERDDPVAVISYFDDWFEGVLSHEALLRHTNRLQDLSFYLFELHESYPKAELIAFAACDVLWIAAWDQASDYEPEYREEDNEAFPADFMIAWLKSGGAPWEPDEAAAERRRRYWEWYIRDAFPRAWEIAYPEK